MEHHCSQSNVSRIYILNNHNEKKLKQNRIMTTQLVGKNKSKSKKPGGSLMLTNQLHNLKTMKTMNLSTNSNAHNNISTRQLSSNNK